MVAVSGQTALNFNLTSTGPLLGALTNCVTTIKAGGINSAGEFAAPKVAAAKNDAAKAPSPSPRSNWTRRSRRSRSLFEARVGRCGSVRFSRVRRRSLPSWDCSIRSLVCRRSAAGRLR